MKIKHKFIIHIILIICVVYGKAQTLEKPNIEVSFDEPNVGVVRNSDNHIKQTYILDGVPAEYIKDRFGREKKAAKLTENQPISSSAFSIAKEKDVTVSFWTYIPQSTFLSTGNRPFKTSMFKKRFFTLSEDQKSGGLAILSKSPVLGIESKLTNMNVLKPWFLWFSAPISMEYSGWYHIVIIYANQYTKIYIYKPNGENYCTLINRKNEFPKKFSIGGNKCYYGDNNKLVKSAEIIDDVQVWYKELSKNKIDILNRKEGLLNTPYSTEVLNKQFIVRGEKCLSYQNDKMIWKSFKDPQGNFNYNMCAKVSVHKRDDNEAETLANEYSFEILNPKKLYIVPGGKLEQVKLNDYNLSTYGLETSKELTYNKVFSLSEGKLAIRHGNKVTMPIILKTSESLLSNEKQDVIASSVSHNHIFHSNHNANTTNNAIIGTVVTGSIVTSTILLKKFFGRRIYRFVQNRLTSAYSNVGRVVRYSKLQNVTICTK